jgi:hypothetical protein
VNIDEGSPYSWDEVGDSNNYNCFINFPVVPDGKMLVIHHVGAVVRPASGSTVVEVAELVTSNPVDTSIGVRNYFGMKRIGVTGESIVADTWAINQPVLAYVLSGRYAQMTINLHSPGKVDFCQATISGLMVDAESNAEGDSPTAG